MKLNVVNGMINDKLEVCQQRCFSFILIIDASYLDAY